MPDNTAPAAAPVTTPDSSNQSGQQPTGNQTQSGQQQGKLSSDAPKQPSLVRKFKADGKEIEVNLGDEQQLAQLLQDASLGKAAFNRMREASEVTKKAQALVERFKKDPLAHLDDPDLQLSDEQKRDAIEKYYQKKWLEAEKLTPEQRRIRELEAEKQKWEDERKQQAEAQKSQQQKALETKWRDTYQQQIIQAIEKGGLPKIPWTAARVAFYMAQAQEAGFEAPMEMIIQQVGKDCESVLQSTCSDNVPIELILKVLPPGLIKRLRKYDLDQYKSKQAKLNEPAKPSENTRSSPKTKREERPSYSEVLRKFGG